MAEKRKIIRYSSVNIDGVKYRTLLTDKFRARVKHKEKDPNRVLAFIPGTIVEVLTKKGKKVKEGEMLLILDAMKMRNAIVAPHDGIVKRLLVKKSEIVTKNQLMLVVE